MLILLKASVYLIIFLSFYKLFLEKESFYTSNRYFLLACLILSIVLPTLVVPKLTKNQGIVDNYLTAQLEPSIDYTSNISYDNVELNSVSDIPGNIQGEELINNLDSDGIIKQENKISNAFNSPWIWIDYGIMIYLFGSAVLFVLFIIQIVYIFFQVWTNEDKVKANDYTIVNLSHDTAPCSFFNYIFINPGKYDFETYNQILEHEIIHVRQRHSIDLILAELAVILLWFNPFVWIFRKEVEKNIEYQTDGLLLNNAGLEADEYQLNLIKVATYQKPLRITTNYNQSLLKKRILRMTSPKSNPFSSLEVFICPTGDFYKSSFC